MRPPRRAVVALAFALAALAASWSPLAAPFGLLTGLGAAVLARTAGLGGLGRQAVPTPVPGEKATGQRLDEAAEQSRASRDRAAQQAGPAAGPGPRN